MLRRLDSLVQPECAVGGDGSAICTRAANGGGLRRFRWRIGSLEVGPVTYERDAHGRKRKGRRELRKVFSTKRTITIPRGRGGEPIVCTIYASAGPSHRIEASSEELRISKRAKR